MDVHISLIRRCKENDLEAFNVLLPQYEGLLYRICYNYTHNQEDALDIMQEVFLKIYRSIASFDESRPLLPWLKKITINTCINFHRDQSDISLLPLENGSDNNLLDTLAAPDKPEDDVLTSSMEEAIWKYIDQLPSPQKMALNLRSQEGMSYEEIASAMALPIGTVKSYVSRARSTLRTLLLRDGFMEV